VNATPRRYPWGLWLIGAFKFASGLGLVALGIGLFRNVDSDPGVAAEHLVATLKLDHDNMYIHSAIAKVSNLSPKQLRAISLGTFLYALMYLIEGTGLLLRKVWGEYFTVFATGFFIPLEIYEVANQLTWLRLGILIINVAIVIYLIYQLVKRRRYEAKTSST
jgi:uncharacterized membrane protein (DUF2068 family)